MTLQERKKQRTVAQKPGRFDGVVSMLVASKLVQDYQEVQVEGIVKALVEEHMSNRSEKGDLVAPKKQALPLYSATLFYLDLSTR